MVVAFDLDDTLYPEETFVRSGFRAVATALHARWGIPEDEAFELMLESLRRHERGRQLDDVVSGLGLRGRQSVAELVRVYRHHSPAISLPAESGAALERLRPRPLYLVTDGHKVVQQNKIDALGIAPLFRHVYITHRYGIHNRKPSVHVFELIMRRERCRADQIIYVGDDPSKDFRGLRPLGVHTLRVTTGRHSAIQVATDEDAERSVESIAAVPAVVAELEAG